MISEIFNLKINCIELNKNGNEFRDICPENAD
jgi:hypothetical protein